MIDFLMISTKSTRRGTIEIYPKFRICKSSDLMIRGGDFYAIWIEERGLWSTEEEDALQLIDHELDEYVKENRKKFDSDIRVLHMWDAETGMIDVWHKYCQRQMRDSFKMLDEKLIFANTKTSKKDYASKCLSYPLAQGSSPSYNKLISTLYDEEERHKIEWAIGSIVSGESKKLQKFVVLYGSAGSGKSTMLNIIQELFEGYYSVFDAKALGSSNNAFALEAFRSNPLLAIQHDGDLSRIEDNTRLNSLVSHEMMTVNEKFKSTYANQFKCFLFMGTNKPVKITDAKSGLIRRLIDVSPSGNKVSALEYKKLVKQVSFELGAIAYHCKEVFEEDPAYYNDYVPTRMLGASNDFYNFVIDSYMKFKQDDSVTLKAAWEMYKIYCEDAKVAFPFSQRIFKEELKNYFSDYKERFNMEDGTRVRSYYEGFRTEKFEDQSPDIKPEPQKHEPEKLEVNETESIFDKEFKDCPAQYAKPNGTPERPWAKITTKLSDLDTTKQHYVKTPSQHIIIDFDLVDSSGNKSLEKNLAEAKKWPPTYAELSRSGNAVHLHYNYVGDVNKLSRIYDDHIEVKVYTGNAALRRKLTKCNALPIANISSGLPLKGDSTVLNFEGLKNEKALRTLIKRNLNKEYHADTTSSINFICKILDDAHASDLKYDVSDMQNSILSFAANSTNQSDYCLKVVKKMKFKSEEPSSFPINAMDVRTDDIIFYDVEVFPNLFVVNWKVKGKDKPVIRMINPSSSDIERLIRFKLVGFNCRRYDNHIMYARLIGKTNIQLYELSQKIISGDRHCFFGEAYNLSYTDIYDFASSGHKQSLKKFEIELGLHHHELGLPWDQPVPEELWTKVAEYCDDDVIATEATFNYLSADWTARQILADLAGMTVNDTTNTLTTKIIFDTNKHPQSQFNWRDMSKPVKYLDPETLDFLKEACPEMMAQTHGPEHSLLPYFKGYKFENGKSTYRGVTVGEGGYAKGKSGMYGNVALLDIASQHPHSAIAEVIFGVKFTKRFKEIVDGRIGIKHKAWSDINEMLGGKLTPYIQRVINGEMTAGDLANALKTAINSVYGLTAAHFDNPFHDPRNIDNIVAKRGALFMLDLKAAINERGFDVAHIKTDSIKIPNATPEIIKFVMDFGKRYGYTFEHEATYDKMTLINDAVYIAKYASPEKCQRLYGYIPEKNVPNPKKAHLNGWTATGTQFAVPYVFKTLFSHEPIIFTDLCETKSVTSSMFLDMNEKLSESDHDYHFIGKVGQFCPIKPGFGGGILLREKTNSKTGEKGYSSITGSKGYRWLESEMVKNLGKEDSIDRSYYAKMVDNAINVITNYGGIDWFASDQEYDQENPEANDILPF